MFAGANGDVVMFVSGGDTIVLAGALQTPFGATNPLQPNVIAKDLTFTG